MVPPQYAVVTLLFYPVSPLLKINTVNPVPSYIVFPCVCEHHIPLIWFVIHACMQYSTVLVHFIQFWLQLYGGLHSQKSVQISNQTLDVWLSEHMGCIALKVHLGRQYTKIFCFIFETSNGNSSKTIALHIKVSWSWSRWSFKPILLFVCMRHSRLHQLKGQSDQKML